nr:serine/threonine-protein kinase [Nocardia sp. XZ_19_385]
MGAVYQARHPRLPRQIALKLLNRELFADNEIRARFEREADLVAQLDHPNIVTVFDRGDEDEQLWISMQYIDGIDASSVDPRTLPPVRAAQIIAETAAALDYAHRMNVLHRDVKPANILLARDAGQERVLLTDFGIAPPRGHRPSHPNRKLHRHTGFRRPGAAHRRAAGSPDGSVFAGVQPVLAAQRHRAVRITAHGNGYPGASATTAAADEQSAARSAPRARRCACSCAGETPR